MEWRLAMLNKHQLRAINAALENALQVAAQEPGILHHLLEMANQEISERLKSQMKVARKAA